MYMYIMIIMDVFVIRDASACRRCPELDSPSARSEDLPSFVCPACVALEVAVQIHEIMD